MHLPQATPGEPANGAVPVAMGQTPAEIIVISAADTELAALSEARIALGDEAPGMRLAQLRWLVHPFSVDQYLDDTACKARLVIVRVLGGAAYWSYGLAQFAQRLHAAGVGFAALPGDDKPDSDLAAASTVSQTDQDALSAYLVEGGPQNATNFLRYAQWMMGAGPKPPGAAPLLRAGLFWPGLQNPALDDLKSHWTPGAAIAALVFYRALLQGAGLQPINRLIHALQRKGVNALPIYVASLKDPVSSATVAQLFEQAPPDIVYNATAFAAGAMEGGVEPVFCRPPTPLDAPGKPVFQIVFSGGTEEGWRDGSRGLSARDIAMHVSLPEVDGRIFTRAVSFKAEAYRDDATECPIAAYQAVDDRIEFVAQLGANWAALARTPAAEKKIALVLAHYPDTDGRLANGVGLDAPASTISVLTALSRAGFSVVAAPKNAKALMRLILQGPTNADMRRAHAGFLSLAQYLSFYARLPWALRRKVEERWGEPQKDPAFLRTGINAGFNIAIHQFGGVYVGVQPARGYNIDPKETTHSADLPPPHGYLAFYAYLRDALGINAVVHMGKHGNLEWLPGKALALSQACFPEAVFGPTPHFYPFIVNDPGEGAQAKRRSQAVIVDHLTPPMTRAESYGDLQELEGLLDEYYEASLVDPRRREYLAAEILFRTRDSGLAADIGITNDAETESALMALDSYLCELKEAQIRDGLHILGQSPEGRLETDLLVALTRAPRGDGVNENASLLRALTGDLLREAFDPLDCAFAAPWSFDRPECLAALSAQAWRTNGDTVERLELMAAQLLAGETAPQPTWSRTRQVLDYVDRALRPALRVSGDREITALIDGLNGQFIDPGSSGAPTRGRPDVLPTGRNFFSIDSRAAPTRAAWALGAKSAELLVERHRHDHGDWLKRIVLTAWGTANMRTGGDDIAQGFALMGVRPVWDTGSTRVCGFEIIALEELGRPRVDVTLRVSGFFRDAFPAQIALFDHAARAVMASDEPEAQNPAAASLRSERIALEAAGLSAADASQQAGFRVFGSKPGAYGAGLQALIDARTADDEQIWAQAKDLGEAYVEWSGYAYGAGQNEEGWGQTAHEALRSRLRRAQAVVQNQDNREHDLLDSDDYYQFEGGAAAAVESLSGAKPQVYHNDHSRPERPIVRTLSEEISRVVRSRVVNPKWIAGVRRHGYKGAFEIAATIDYLFAFAATTGAVQDHHFDLVYDAFIGDDETRRFLEEENPAALSEIESRLQEAVDRELWRPRRNFVAQKMARL